MSTNHSESSELGADSTDHDDGSPVNNAKGCGVDHDEVDSVTTYSTEQGAVDDPNLLGEGNEASTAATGRISPKLELKKTKFAQTQTCAADLACPSHPDLSKTRIYTSVYPLQHHAERTGLQQTQTTPVYNAPAVYHNYLPAAMSYPSVVEPMSTAYSQDPVVCQDNNRLYVNPYPQLTPGTYVRARQQVPVWYCPCIHTENIRYGQVVGYEYLDLPPSNESPWRPLAFWFRQNE